MTPPMSYPLSALIMHHAMLLELSKNIDGCMSDSFFGGSDTSAVAVLESLHNLNRVSCIW